MQVHHAFLHSRSVPRMSQQFLLATPPPPLSALECMVSRKEEALRQLGIEAAHDAAQQALRVAHVCHCALARGEVDVGNHPRRPALCSSLQGMRTLGSFVWHKTPPTRTK